MEHNCIGIVVQTYEAVYSTKHAYSTTWMFLLNKSLLNQPTLSIVNFDKNL